MTVDNNTPIIANFSKVTKTIGDVVVTGETSKAYDEGRATARSNLGRNECPYLFDSERDLREAWMKGYRSWFNDGTSPLP